MSTIRDKATVELFVNGEQAQQALDKLRARAKSLRDALDAAIAAGDKRSEKKLSKELAAVEREINRVNSAASGTKQVLDDIDNVNLHGLTNALKFLKKELANTTPNTEDWAAYAEQIQAVQERIDELRGDAGEDQSWWGKISGAAAQAWPVADFVQQGMAYAGEFVSAYTAMEQQMADVRKFTGLTVEDVAALNEEFKKIDTRTSRENLNKLAQEAGRLGKNSREDVLGFVRAADQINVALDDLGEGATLMLSKLTGAFGDESRYGTEQSLLKVGSVINELSQNCSASSSYLAQFASRVSGVGAQAGMTVQQIMAFAAVLDSNNQGLEASATALSQILVRLYQEPAKYAKVAGLDVKSFSDLIRKDANAALLQFLESLNKAGGINNLAPMFKDMGESGQGAIAALSVLAGQIDKVKEQQAVANEAFAEGSSVVREAAMANSTAEASIEKLRQSANELKVEIGQQLYPVMVKALEGAGKAASATSGLIKWASQHKGAVAAVTAAIIGYTVAIKANIAWGRVSATISATRQALLVAESRITATLSSVTGLLKVQYYKLTGQTAAATAAQQALNASMAATPWGAILTAASAAAIAFGLFGSEADNAADGIDAMADGQAEANAKMAEAKAQIDANIQRINTFNGTKEQESLLVSELNNKYGETFGTFKTLKEWYATLTTKSDAYCQSIAKGIILEAKRQELIDLAKKTNEAERNANADYVIDWDKTLWSFVKQNVKYGLSGSFTSWSEAEWGLNADIKASWAERHKIYKAQQDQLVKEIASGEIELQSLVASLMDGASVVPDNAEPVEPYESQALKDKERKKAEAAKRREEAKAKKEFKSQMNAFKAHKAAADKAALEAYQVGEIDYEALLARRYENERKFYTESISFFEKTFAGKKDSYLQDDKDYQELLKAKQKADENYDKESAELRQARIVRKRELGEAEAKAEAETNGNQSLQAEIRLQAKLYAIRKQALEDTLALHKEGSKEWMEIQMQIEDLGRKKNFEAEKIYFAAVNAMRRDYEERSAAERYYLEKATFDALLAAGEIPKEMYERAVSALKAKLATELPGESSTAESTAEQAKYDKELMWLTSALNAKIISQQEYYERIDALDDAHREKMFAGLKQQGGEWNAMLTDVYLSFASLFSGLDDSTSGVLGKVSNCVATVSAVVAAGMQIATEFAKAEAEVQTKAVEARYEREVELAQGNSYKTAQLERKKEKELAAIKNEANKKQFAMQVIQAIAQTATNALGAYGSAVKVPVVGHILAPIAAAMAVAQGAVQVALIKKQQQAAEAQGYSRGGFTKPGRVDEPAGIVHAGEWVASQCLLASPVARPMIEALDYAQRTNTIGQLSAADVSRSIVAGDAIVRLTEANPSGVAADIAMSAVASQLKRLNERLNEPFVTVNTITGDAGIKQAQEEYMKLTNNVTPKRYRK